MRTATVVAMAAPVSWRKKTGSFQTFKARNALSMSAVVAAASSIETTPPPRRTATAAAIVDSSTVTKPRR